jgi:hypothetical protein
MQLNAYDLRFRPPPLRYGGIAETPTSLISFFAPSARFFTPPPFFSAFGGAVFPFRASPDFLGI